MKKIILVALLYFLPELVYAHVTERGKITQVITEGSHVVSVILDGVDDTSLCAGGYRWTLTDADPRFKDKYALLLVALSTGKEIMLEHLDTSACGPWNSNTIYFVSYYR